MQKQKINSLVWFRNNLRVEDNSSLTNAINSSDKIIGFINITQEILFLQSMDLKKQRNLE